MKEEFKNSTLEFNLNNGEDISYVREIINSFSKEGFVFSWLRHSNQKKSVDLLGKKSLEEAQKVCFANLDQAEKAKLLIESVGKFSVKYSEPTQWVTIDGETANFGSIELAKNKFTSESTKGHKRIHFSNGNRPPSFGNVDKIYEEFERKQKKLKLKKITTEKLEPSIDINTQIDNQNYHDGNEDFSARSHDTDLIEKLEKTLKENDELNTISKKLNDRILMLENERSYFKKKIKMLENKVLDLEKKKKSQTPLEKNSYRTPPKFLQWVLLTFFHIEVEEKNVWEYFADPCPYKIFDMEQSKFCSQENDSLRNDCDWVIKFYKIGHVAFLVNPPFNDKISSINNFFKKIIETLINFGKNNEEELKIFFLIPVNSSTKYFNDLLNHCKSLTFLPPLTFLDDNFNEYPGAFMGHLCLFQFSSKVSFQEKNTFSSFLLDKPTLNGRSVLHLEKMIK